MSIMGGSSTPLITILPGAVGFAQQVEQFREKSHADYRCGRRLRAALKAYPSPAAMIPANVSAPTRADGAKMVEEIGKGCFQADK
jgi:hypothetical protein